MKYENYLSLFFVLVYIILVCSNEGLILSIIINFDISCGLTPQNPSIIYMKRFFKDKQKERKTKSMVLHTKLMQKKKKLWTKQRKLKYMRKVQPNIVRQRRILRKLNPIFYTPKFINLLNTVITFLRYTTSQLCIHLSHLPLKVQWMI